MIYKKKPTHRNNQKLLVRTPVEQIIKEINPPLEETITL